MASEVVITSLEDRIKQFGEASTKNPEMRKRINEVIRQALSKAREALRSQAKSGLGMESDPRNAYKAVRMAVYRRIFGGQVNILNPRTAYSGGYYYEPPRHPSRRGGNRRPQSMRTKKVMSYEGPDRGFVLRFLNQGTTGRNITHLTEIKRASGGSKFRFTSDGGAYGNRGSIAARNWFSGASLRQLENVSLEIDGLIDNILWDIFE